MSSHRIERVTGTVVFDDGTEKPFNVTLPDATRAEEWGAPLVGILKAAETLRGTASERGTQDVLGRPDRGLEGPRVSGGVRQGQP